MWVADMEFKAPSQVLDALKERIDHGVFGYSSIPESYFKAFMDWEETHYGYKLDKEWLRFSTGVVTALYWFVNMFTKEKDSVLILTPVYYPFHNCVKDNNRTLITCDLIYDKGDLTIYFHEFEQKIISNQVKLFLLASPHNPGSRVWKQEELEHLMEICAKHNVIVISDEIHQDIVLKGHQHIPIATVCNGMHQNNIITVTSPSKTFNLASCLTSNIIIPNEHLRKIYDDYTKKINQTECNILGFIAGEAAYRWGEEWRQGLLNVIEDNFSYVKKTLADRTPHIIITPLEGTYLLWLNLRPCIAPKDVKDFIQNKCRLAVNYGEWFGSNWKGFIRINLATYPDIVKQAIHNIIENMKEIS